MTNKETNNHIRKFLKYYIETDNIDYAVLINGKWGSGKTWFIKDFIEKNKEIDFLYINLYGINEISQINSQITFEFIKKQNPDKFKDGDLLSLVTKFSSSIINNVIFQKIGFDLLGNCGNELKNILNNKIINENTIFIFDDLERCLIPLEVMGYINTLVEHQNCKVIIISNEEEIKTKQSNSEKNTKQYNLVKEKVIGKTFEVEPETYEALEYFLKKLDIKPKTFLEKHTQEILTVFNLFKEKNLRILKQSIFDFSRLYNAFDEDVLNKNDLLKDVLEKFLALSFEAKKDSSFLKYMSPNYNHYKEYVDKEGNLNIENKGKEETPIKNIIEKYSLILNGFNLIYEIYNPLEKETWYNILGKNFIDNGAINDELKQSHYFYDERTPSWQQLWRWRLWRVSDDEFSKYLCDVKTKYSNKEYKQLEEVKHITGIFIALSKEGLFDKNKDEIIKKAQSYVDYLKENNLLGRDIENSEKYRNIISGNTSYGLQYQSNEDNDFENFKKYCDDKNQESITKNTENMAYELLEQMNEENIEVFLDSLTIGNGNVKVDKHYYNIPILSYIKEKKFVEKIIILENKDKIEILSLFNQRYNYDIRSLLPELNWLEGVKKLLGKKIENMEPKLSRYLLKMISEEIGKSIKNLKNFNSQTISNP